jgi:hypothetical protein
MIWVEAERGWVAVPEEIVGALSRDGFEKCEAGDDATPDPPRDDHEDGGEG